MRAHTHFGLEGGYYTTCRRCGRLIYRYRRSGLELEVISRVIHVCTPCWQNSPPRPEPNPQPQPQPKPKPPIYQPGVPLPLWQQRVQPNP